MLQDSQMAASIQPAISISPKCHADLSKGMAGCAPDYLTRKLIKLANVGKHTIKNFQQLTNPLELPLSGTS